MANHRIDRLVAYRRRLIKGLGAVALACGRMDARSSTETAIPADRAAALPPAAVLSPRTAGKSELSALPPNRLRQGG